MLDDKFKRLNDNILTSANKLKETVSDYTHDCQKMIDYLVNELALAEMRIEQLEKEKK